MRVRKVPEVKTTSSSVLSASVDSDSGGTPSAAGLKPTTGPKETELVQSFAKFVQAQTDVPWHLTQWHLCLLTLLYNITMT